MKHILIIVASIALIQFSGCKKNSTKVNSSGSKNIDNVLCAPQYYSMAEYYKEFLNSNRLGQYTVNSYSSDGITQYTAGGFFYPNAERKTFTKIGDNVFINSLHVNEYNAASGAYPMLDGIEKQLSQLFGKQISISITSNLPNKNNETTNTSVDLYSPKDFYVSSNIGTIDRSKSFTINWNADVQNKNGVAIVVYWTAELAIPKTDGSLGPNYSGNVVRNVDITDDMGTYVFNGEKMLKDIPKDARVDISLYRGSYKLVTINNIEYRFQSYSEWHSTTRNVIN